jgi:hypothetical protein
LAYDAIDSGQMTNILNKAIPNVALLLELTSWLINEFKTNQYRNIKFPLDKKVF